MKLSFIHLRGKKPTDMEFYFDKCSLLVYLRGYKYFILTYPSSLSANTGDNGHIKLIKL